MFDVEAINDIELTAISYRIYGGSSDIKIYSAPRTYVGIETNANAWTLIAAGSVATSSKSPYFINQARRTQFFVFHSNIPFS
jgi:hypothetical protein